MGRTLENKKEIVAELKDLLSDTQSIFVIDYKGLTVGEISDLRNRIREKGGKAEEIYYERIGHIALVASLGRPLHSLSPALDDIDRFFRARAAQAGQAC